MDLLVSIVDHVYPVAFLSPFFYLAFWPDIQDWRKHRKLIRQTTVWRDELG